jgi:hypothetical protein
MSMLIKGSLTEQQCMQNYNRLSHSICTSVSYIPTHIGKMFAYSEHSPVAGHNLNHAFSPRASALEDYSASE